MAKPVAEEQRMALPAPQEHEMPAPGKGEYRQPQASDLRSPCPMINALANHGYIPRDGRSVRQAELRSALTDQVGVSAILATAFANPVFCENHDSASMPRVWARLWKILRDPFALLGIGVRNPGQVDSMGNACVDLDQLGKEGLIEHDISLTRKDRAQGDAISADPHLVHALLAHSSDDGNTITLEDVVAYRRYRIQKQKNENQNLIYGTVEDTCGALEVLLLMTFLGDGQRARVEWLNTFLLEGRLPHAEGWQRRQSSWGIFDMLFGLRRVVRMIHDDSASRGRTVTSQN